MANDILDEQFAQGRQQRLQQFVPPKPKEQLREGEVEALADALEQVMLEASDGQIQPGAEVDLSVGSGMKDGAVTAELFGALEMLSGFLDMVGEQHPELGQYAFDHKKAVSTREDVLQTAASLKQLANDRKAMSRMKTFAPTAPTETTDVPEAEASADMIDVSSLFEGGSDGE